MRPGANIGICEYLREGEMRESRDTGICKYLIGWEDEAEHKREHWHWRVSERRGRCVRP
jgi:hypothetical protein